MLYPFMVPVVFTIAVIVALIIYARIKAKQQAEHLQQAFGRVLESGVTFDVSDYHQYRLQGAPLNLPYIDKTTWRDLNMDAVFGRICVCQTRLGQEYLYHRMHGMQGDPMLNRWVAYFEQNPDVRFIFQKNLAHIGSSDFSLVPYFLDVKKDALPLPAWLYHLLAWLIVAIAGFSAIGYFVFPAIVPYLLLSLIPASLINIVIYYKTKLMLENGLSRLSYFGHVLYGCKKIIQSDSPDMQSALNRLKEAYHVFSRIKGKFSKRAAGLMSELSFMQEYLFMILLIDINRYHQSINFIARHTDAFRTIFETIGQIDAAVSVLSYQKSVAYFCKPTLQHENTISFQRVYHPLLKQPVANSGKIARHALVTGVNASGKSTFLKTLAINQILGLSIDTCLAKSYTIKRTLVISAMAITDNILEGESYYIAEVKALKRVLDAIAEYPCTCFVDEILRGTNTVDRLSATTAVLLYIKNSQSLCVFATHDTDLAHFFDKDYENYHFSETVSDTEVTFDYLLKTGIATEKNAIRLLSLYQYPADIIDRAKETAEKLQDIPAPMRHLDQQDKADE